MNERTSLNLIALLLLALLITACDSGSGPSSPGLLQLAVANMRGLKTYHLEERGFVGNVQVTLAGDFDVANKRYSTSETYVAEGGSKQAYDLIIIGSDRYIRDTGAGKAVFVKDTEGSSDLATTTLSGLWLNVRDSDVTSATASLKEQADETIDGVAVRHLAIPSTALPALNFLAAGTDPNFDIQLWVSPAYPPRVLQMRLTGKLKQGGNFDLLLNWSHFDAPLTIEPPVGG